jgi:carboxypeptidase A inhibitor
MRPWIVAWVLFGALALGCGGGAERGETCEKTSECAEGLRCISYAIGCTSDCPGSCEEPCETNADCSSGWVCVSTRGDAFCEKEDFHIN